MSTFLYYKTTFEGKIDAVFELIHNRDWNISVKMPEEGILYMKVSEETEDEVLFNQNLVFDEPTGSKFGKFEKISESEYEVAQNIELPSDTIKEKPKAKSIENSFENFLKKKSLNKGASQEFKTKDDKKSVENNSFLGVNLSDLKSAIPPINCNVTDFVKSMHGNHYYTEYNKSKNFFL